MSFEYPDPLRIPERDFNRLARRIQEAIVELTNDSPTDAKVTLEKALKEHSSTIERIRLERSLEWGK